MNVNEQKQQIRKLIKQKLLAQSKLERENFSKIICDRLLQNESVISAKNVCLYYATEIEVDLTAMISALISRGVGVYLPRVNGENLDICKISSLKEMQVGKWNIREPIGEKIEDLSILDVVIVPLVAFDGSFNRLGHGKGFYDRFLKTQKHALKIGVAFSIQQVEKVPTCEFDEKLNLIITEK